MNSIMLISVVVEYVIYTHVFHITAAMSSIQKNWTSSADYVMAVLCIQAFTKEIICKPQSFICYFPVLIVYLLSLSLEYT